jgi:hypothetical protein
MLLSRVRAALARLEAAFGVYRVQRRVRVMASDLPAVLDRSHVRRIIASTEKLRAMSPRQTDSMLTDSTISLLRSHDVGPQTHRETKSVQIFASEIDVISVRFELDQLCAARVEVTCLGQSLESVE